MSRDFSRPGLTLTHGPGSRYRVDLEAFFDLSFSLAEDLENLVDDWSYFVRGRASSSDRITQPQQKAKH